MSLKKYPIFLPNKGQVLNKPQEFLNDQVSACSRNMEFFNEFLKGRGGLSKFSSTALSGRILHIANLKLFNGSEFVIFCTPKDIYSYDFANSRFDILNILYNTGTITIAGGTPTIVTGSGTLWEANLKAGDYIKIGAGNVHTGATWYEIESVDSNTQLTLTSSAATCTDSAYVARKTFTGSTTHYWASEPFIDGSLGEVIVLTNGLDTPVYWTGSGQVVALTGLPIGFVSAKYVTAYKGRLIFLWCIVGSNEPTLQFMSDVGNCLSWDDSNFRYFNEENTDEIRGSVVFNGYHIVLKERNAYIGRYVGGSTIFDYEENSECQGCIAPASVIKTSSYIFYYGSDRKFHRWNILQDQIISEESFPETKEFDPNNDEFIQGYNVKNKNQIRWFCPYNDAEKHNYVYVFDYQQNIPQVWEYQNADACCSFGSYTRSDDVYADDAIYGEQYADETAGYADDSQFLDASRILIYGGYDGYIRIADSGSTDDGIEFTRLLRLKRLNFEDSDKRKRLKAQIWWLEAATSGEVTVKLMLDDKTSYNPVTKTISLISSDSDKDIIKKTITWNKHAQTFQPEISAVNDFSVLGVVNEISFKGEVV